MKVRTSELLRTPERYNILSIILFRKVGHWTCANRYSLATVACSRSTRALLTGGIIWNRLRRKNLL